MKITRSVAFAIAAFGWLSPVPVRAQIVDTEASVSIRIADQGGVFTAHQTANTHVSRQVTSPTGSIVSAALAIDPLSAHAATVDLDFSMAGGPQAEGYMGLDTQSQTPNRAQLSYEAFTDGAVSIGWSFDYLGSRPFGLNSIDVFENGTRILTLGNVGEIGHHEGSEVVAISRGSHYVFEVSFNPNVGGAIWDIEGQLVGSIRFEFPQLCDAPTVVGTQFDDVLVGTPGPDVIAGLAGNDVIAGQGGDDVLCGGEGSDVISGGDGDDVIEGGAGADNLSGDAGSDVISGGDGGDNISGGAGDDLVDGGAGDDNLSGGAGRDQAIGGAGHDRCSAESKRQCEH